MSLRFRVPALAVIAVAGVWGQIGGGSIVGTVRDPSGAPVTGAKVQAHHQETNEERLVTTNAEGYYEFPLLAPGHYRLLAEAVGFEKQHGAVTLIYSARDDRRNQAVVLRAFLQGSG